nr:CCA tRNA nucleotidyltransferase [Pseudoroseicyclus aestuarii]
MLEAAGHRAFFVGGCVRNALIGAPVSDLDLTTDARPEEVVALAEAAGLKPVPTGIAHGTVTVVAHGEPVEVTTFRRDVETFGRKARVAFTDDIAQDAARRDFTMNALYAASDGVIHDPLGGLPDLQARHVRFIGDPAARIAEDHLRILRFFRFYAWYGDTGSGIDVDGLAACAEAVEDLAALSKERVGAELLKLLAAPDPAPALASMARCGALGQILPGAGGSALAVLVHVEQSVGRAPDPLRRLAMIGGQEPETMLRLSKAQAARLDRLREGASGVDSPLALGYRLGAADGLDALAVRAAMEGRELPGEAAEAAKTGAGAEFPIAAKDLMPDWQGAALGARLKQLEEAWIASGFALDRQALLALP